MTPPSATTIVKVNRSDKSDHGSDSLSSSEIKVIAPRLNDRESNYVIADRKSDRGSLLSPSEPA